MTDMHSSAGWVLMMRSDCQMESTPPASHMSTHFQKPRASSKVKFAMPIPAPIDMVPPYCVLRSVWLRPPGSRQLMHFSQG